MSNQPSSMDNQPVDPAHEAMEPKMEQDMEQEQTQNFSPSTTDNDTAILSDASDTIDLQASEASDQVIALQATIAELEDRLKRAFAEQQNQRQRMLKEKSNAERYGAAKFATDLFEVMDNLDRALQSVSFAAADDPHVSNLVTGVQMVQQQMAGVLNSHHIKEIVPLGEAFDYNLHETIAESDHDPAPANTIIEVAQKGYMLHDRLLRPAKVVISSGRGGSSDGDRQSVDQEV